MGILFGNALTAFGLGAGRGWGEPEIISKAFLFYLIFAVYGAIFGAGFGLIGAVIRRDLARSVPGIRVVGVPSADPPRSEGGPIRPHP